jgi:hypothetical protein
MQENKTFLHFIFFFDVPMKTGYFHTGLVSLPYKKYKQILINNASTNFQKITYLNNSLKENFLNGPDSTQRKMGRNQPKNKMGLLSTGLDSAQPKPHDWLLFTVQ